MKAYQILYAFPSVSAVKKIWTRGPVAFQYETKTFDCYEFFLPPPSKSHHRFDANIHSREILQETQKNCRGPKASYHHFKIFSVSPG